MPSVDDRIVIAGPARAIFDLVTSARFWPQWHPITREVGGVTQRPYRLGDLVHVKGEIDRAAFLMTWRVVEHRPPSRVVLESSSPPARAVYEFEPQGDGVSVRRILDYPDVGALGLVFRREELAAFMEQKSHESMARIKALVERVLHEENRSLASCDE